MADQEELLGELPASLKAEIISMVYQKTFETIHFFNGKDPNFLLGLMPLLRHLVLNKREIAYSEGDLPEDIYFIEKGRIKLVDEDGIRDIVRVFCLMDIYNIYIYIYMEFSTLRFILENAKKTWILP